MVNVKIFLPPLNATNIAVGLVALLLLSGCSSPVKYPSRSSQAPVNLPLESDSSMVNDTEEMQVVCGEVYYVKWGDSLSEIAYNCGVPMRQLAALNNIPPPYAIYEDQQLQLSPTEHYKPKYQKRKRNVEKKPVVSTIQKTVLQPSILPPKLPQLKNAQENKTLKHSPWEWPVHKSLPYRFIKDDSGLSVIEIYGVAGQEIKAVSRGSVVYSGEGITEFGKMVVIKHDDEYMSVYAHNSDLLVKEGDRVQAGQQIATLGATGNASQPKLYLEARFKGRKIDVLKVLTVPKSN